MDFYGFQWGFHWKAIEIHRFSIEFKWVSLETS